VTVNVAYPQRLASRTYNETKQLMQLIYKMALVRFKVQQPAKLVHLSRHLRIWNFVHNNVWLSDSDAPMLFQPFYRTDFTKHAFSHSATAARNSFCRTILENTLLRVFTSRRNTHPFHLAHNIRQWLH